MESNPFLSLLAGFLEEQSELLGHQAKRLRQFQGPVSVVYNGSGKEAKKKTPVDPNRPKQPLSGYQLFAQKKMLEVRENNPGLVSTEIMRIVGKAWTDTPEKEYYLALAKENKKAYVAELERYVSMPPDQQKIVAELSNAKKVNEALAAASKAKSFSSMLASSEPTGAYVEDSESGDKKKKKRSNEKKVRYNNVSFT